MINWICFEGVMLSNVVVNHDHWESIFIWQCPRPYTTSICPMFVTGSDCEHRYLSNCPQICIIGVGIATITMFKITIQNYCDSLQSMIQVLSFDFCNTLRFISHIHYVLYTGSPCALLARILFFLPQLPFQFPLRCKRRMRYYATSCGVQKQCYVRVNNVIWIYLCNS